MAACLSPLFVDAAVSQPIRKHVREPRSDGWPAATPKRDRLSAQTLGVGPPMCGGPHGTSHENPQFADIFEYSRFGRRLTETSLSGGYVALFVDQSSSSSRKPWLTNTPVVNPGTVTAPLLA